MPTNRSKLYGQSKKGRERRALDEARTLCAAIPSGEIEDYERPDFKIHSAEGVVGVEVTELLPQAQSGQFLNALAEQSLHYRIVKQAEERYNSEPEPIPVQLTTYAWPIEGDCDEREVVENLVDFVRSRAHEPDTYVRRDQLPQGFGVVSIVSGKGPWTAFESSRSTAESIRNGLAQRIREKNDHLPMYRSRIPKAPIWLLIYSCLEVSRGVFIPAGELTFPFNFERVLFLSCLDNRVVEIVNSEPL